MQKQVARINLQGFRDGGEDRNEEFAPKRTPSFFSRTRQPKRPQLTRKRSIGGPSAHRVSWRSTSSDGSEEATRPKVKRSDSIERGWHVGFDDEEEEQSDSLVELTTFNVGRGVERRAVSTQKRSVDRNPFSGSEHSSKDAFHGLGRGVQRTRSPEMGARWSHSAKQERHGGSRSTFYSSDGNKNDDDASGGTAPSISFI